MTTGDSLARVCLTTSFFLCSLPTDLTAGSKRCQPGGKAGSERGSHSWISPAGLLLHSYQKGNIES